MRDGLAPLGAAIAALVVAAPAAPAWAADGTPIGTQPPASSRDVADLPGYDLPSDDGLTLADSGTAPRADFARSERRRRGGHMLPAMLWSLLPGGGHFYLGDISGGIAYAGLTGAFLATGAVVQDRNDELDREDEVNVSELVGEKVWEYSVFTTFREAAKADGIDLRANRFDDTPTSTLLLAPFSPSQFTRPTVFLPALLGIAGAALAAQDRENGSLKHVTRARMFGSDFNRNDATGLYAASSLMVSLGAGAAEEGLFRGIEQPLLEEQWGETAGLWATAGTFGAAHIVGVDGELNLEGVLFATGAGAYLGWLYDHDDHRLAGPVAAHFWYDFMVFATSWVMEPDDTPFGFGVDFQF